MNASTSNKSDARRCVPTVSRATSDTLVELVYDPIKRQTALAVSRFNGLWNIEQEVKIETGRDACAVLCQEQSHRLRLCAPSVRPRRVWLERS